MSHCRKASQRRNRPECPLCTHYVRRGIAQHLKRCEVVRRLLREGW